MVKDEVKFNDTEVDAPKSWPQICAILIACLNGIVGGLIYAWPSPSIPVLLAEDNGYNMTLTELSYLPIIPPLGIIISAPFVCSFIDIFGRKYALLSCTFCYVLSLVLVIIGGPLWMYYLSRFVDGIGDACIFSILPCYVSEISSPKVRSTWGNSVSLSMYFGQLVINTAGSYLAIPHAAIISLIFPALFVLNVYFLPESPYHLLKQDRIEEARQSLQWLRGQRNVELELSQLIVDVKRQSSETGRFVDIFLIASNRRSAIIVVVVRWIQAFAGATTFGAFIQTIFIMSGSSLSSSTSSILYIATMGVTSAVASSFLDRLGLRRATLISCTGCALVLLSIAAVFYVNDETDLEIAAAFNVLPLTLLIAYVILYSASLSIVPTLILGELFSSSIKSKAYVLANINYGVCLAVAGQVFALLLQNVGLYAIFLFYGLCTFFGIFVIYFILPETRGKTLEEIQQSIKSTSTLPAVPA